MLKLQKKNKIKGGRPIRIVRNNIVMTIDEKDIEDGDSLSFAVGFNQGGLVSDFANHNLSAVARRNNAEPPTVQVMERFIEQHPTTLVMYEPDPEVDFQRERREREHKIKLKILQKQEDLLDEKISIAAHARILSMSAASGFTCCTCLGMIEQLTYNLASNTGNLAKAAVVGAKDIVVDAVNIVPRVDGITAIGNFIYGLSAYGSQKSKDFFESITPIASPTEYSPIPIIPGTITPEQINYFDAILQSCKRTDVRCGMSLAMATCCVCYHLETKEGKRRADTVTMGRDFIEYDNAQARIENKNFAKNVVSAVGAGVSIFGSPALGSTISAASALLNTEQPPARQQTLGYGQIRNPEQGQYIVEEPSENPISEIRDSNKGTLVRRIPYTYRNGGKRKINKGKTNTKKKSKTNLRKYNK